MRKIFHFVSNEKRSVQRLIFNEKSFILTAINFSSPSYIVNITIYLRI